MRLTSKLTKIVEILNKAVVQKVIVYDMKNVTPFYDYIIVSTVNTSRQGHATVDYLRKDAEKQGFTVRGYSDNPEAKWYLIDLENVIVHVFVGDEREKYNLDGLYYNLEKIELE